MCEQKPIFEQYKVIHESIQGWHTYSWQSTAIIIPMLGAGIYYLVNEIKGFEESLVFGGVIIGVCFFWLYWQKYLYQCNRIRAKMAREFEKEIHGDDWRKYGYYNRLHIKLKKPVIGRMFNVNYIIAAVYIIAVVLVGCQRSTLNGG